MKQFVSFLGEFDADSASLEVFACALSARELETAMAELEATGFRFISIDSDSIRAKLSAEYDVVIETMRALEKDGWKWNTEEGE